jgi:hypothetical protein
VYIHAESAAIVAVPHFLESIHAPREVLSGDDLECAKVWPYLLRKHGPSLRKLVVWLGM